MGRKHRLLLAALILISTILVFQNCADVHIKQPDSVQQPSKAPTPVTPPSGTPNPAATPSASPAPTSSPAPETDINGIPVPSTAYTTTDVLPYANSGRHPNSGFYDGYAGVDASEMSPARCSNSSIQHSYQLNILIDNSQQSYLSKPMNIRLVRGEVFSYKAHTGTDESGHGFMYSPVSGANANIRPVYLTVSKTPCDFDLTKLYTDQNGQLLPGGSSCYRGNRAGAETSVVWTTSSMTGLPSEYCHLDKDTDYYFNIRFEDILTGQDSCQPGETCGGSLVIN